MPCMPALFVTADLLCRDGRKLSLCWAAGRENNTGRRLAMTALTNDCRALLLGQINYLSLWLILLNSSFIIKWEKRGKRLSCIQPINYDAEKSKYVSCTWCWLKHCVRMHGRNLVYLVTRLCLPNLTTHITISLPSVCLNPGCWSG